jgi:hypothetical protein
VKEMHSSLKNEIKEADKSSEKYMPKIKLQSTSSL